MAPPVGQREHSWTCRFGVQCPLTQGPPEWRYYQFDSLEFGPPQRKPEGPLQEYASQVLGQLQNLRTAYAIPVPPAPTGSPQATVLQWIADGGKPVPRGGTPPPLSSIAARLLNTLVASGSLQPGFWVSTVVDRHVTIEIRANSGRSTWFYERQDRPIWQEFTDEYLLAFPDLFVKAVDSTASTSAIPNSPPRLQLAVLDGAELKSALEILDAHRILYEYAVESYAHGVADNLLTIHLRIKGTLVPYPKGRMCRCIPIPGKKKEFDSRRLREPWSVLTPEVVVSSPNVATTLTELSRIWQDRFAQSVLLSAPPGSGKEAFALSVGPGSGRDPAGAREVSLAGDQDALPHQLFGKRRDDGSVEPGLIAQAAKSQLFLDEAHYPDRLGDTGIRAALLRPLEAREYLPVGSTQAVKVDDVLFVFATSWRLTTDPAPPSAAPPGPLLKDLAPQDFWTRMTHFLEIKHPLDLPPNEVSLDDVLMHFFKFFWWYSAEKYFGTDITLHDVKYDSISSVDVSSERPADLLRRRQLNILFADATFDAIAPELRQALAATLSDAPLSRLSVRGLRSIAQRLFSFAISNLLGGQTDMVSEAFRKELAVTVKAVVSLAMLKA